MRHDLQVDAQESTPVPQCPSRAKLRTDVANFMDRAGEIVNHPLAQHQPAFEILMHFDPKSMLLTHANLDWENVEKAGLLRSYVTGG